MEHEKVRDIGTKFEFDELNVGIRLFLVICHRFCT